MTRFAPAHPERLPTYEPPTLTAEEADWRRFLARKRMVDIANNLAPIGEEREPEDVFIRNRLREHAEEILGVGDDVANVALGPLEGEHEDQFRDWYGQLAGRMDLGEDPDDPRDRYDYRRAFLADAQPDEAGQLPPEFRLADHPDRYVEGADTITGSSAQQRAWAHQYLANLNVDQREALAEAEADRVAWAGSDPGEIAQRAGEYIESGVHHRATARQMKADGWRDQVISTAYLQNIEDNIQIALDEGEWESAARLRFAKGQLLRYGPNIDPNGPAVHWADRYLVDSLRVQVQEMGGVARLRYTMANAVVESARMLRRFAGAQGPEDRDVMELMAGVIMEESPGIGFGGTLLGSFMDPGWYFAGGLAVKGVSKAIGVVGGEAAQAAIRTRHAQRLVRMGKTPAVAEAAAARLTPEAHAMSRISAWAEKAAEKRGFALSARQSDTVGRMVFRSVEGAIGNAAVEAGIAVSLDQPLPEVMEAAFRGAVIGTAFGAVLDRALVGGGAAIRKARQIAGVDIPPRFRELMAAEIDAAREIGLDDAELDVYREELITGFRNVDEAQRLNKGKPLTDDEVLGIMVESGVDLRMRDAAAEARAQQAAAAELDQAIERAGGMEYVQRVGRMNQESVADEILGLRTTLRRLEERPAPGDTPASRRRQENVERVQGKLRTAEEVYRRRFDEEPPSGDVEAPAVPETPEGAQERLEAIEDRLMGPEVDDATRQALTQEWVDLSIRAEELKGGRGVIPARPEDRAGELAQVRERLDALEGMFEPPSSPRLRQRLVREYDAIRSEYPQVRTRPTRERAARGRSRALAEARRRAERRRQVQERRGGEGGEGLERAPEPSPEPEAPPYPYRPGDRVPQKELTRIRQAMRARKYTPDSLVHTTSLDNLEAIAREGIQPTLDADGDLSVSASRVDESGTATGGAMSYGREGIPVVLELGPKVSALDEGVGDTFVRSDASSFVRPEDIAAVYIGDDPTAYSLEEAVGKIAQEGAGPERAQAPAPEPESPTTPVSEPLTRVQTPEPRPPGEAIPREPSPATPEPSPAAPAPIAGAVEGVGGNLALPSGRSIPYRYAVVPADRLVPSHDARRGFVENPAGDPNERAYADPSEGAASRQTVTRIADDPNPDLLLTDTPTATDGPPIARTSGVVLGGNARAMGMQLAYSRGGEPAQRIRDALLERAERFGLDPDEVRAMQDPVLVRMIGEEEAGAPGELSRVLNQPLTTARSADTDAVSRGRMLSPTQLASIVEIIGDGTLRDALNDPGRTRRILSTLMNRRGEVDLGGGAFDESDFIGMIDQRGLLTATGRDVVERTLLGAAVGDVRRMAQTAPATRNKLIRAVPAISRIRAASEQGPRAVSADFETDLRDGLDAMFAYRESGARSFEDLMSQSTMFQAEEGWRENGRGIGLARSLTHDTPSEFVRKMRELSEAVQAEATGQGGLFGGDDPSAAVGDAYARNFPALEGGPASMPRGGGLFDVAEGETRPRRADAGTPAEAGAERAGAFDGIPIVNGDAMGELVRVPPVLRPIEMPELFKLAKELMGRPPLVKRLGGPRGVMQADRLGGAAIGIDPRTAKDPEQLALTLAHEIGHLIDYLPEGELRRGNLIGRVKSLQPTLDAIGRFRGFMRNTFGNLNNKELRAELIELSAVWRPWNRDVASDWFRRYRDSSIELYADALSAFLNSPGFLQERAPKFYAALLENMDLKPEVKRVYLDLQDLLAGEPAELASVRRADIREGFGKAEEVLRARAEERKASQISLIHSVRQLLLDKAAPLIDRDKKLMARGVSIDESRSAEMALDELNYRDSANHVLLERLEREIHQPILDAGLSIEDVGEYLLLRRIANERTEIANPYGHVPATAEAQLANLVETLGPAKAEALARYTQQFDDMVFDVAERAHESGLINDQTWNETIVPNRGNYATFAVIDYLTENMSPTIRKQVGTFKEVANPFLGTVLKTMAQVRATELNNAKRTIRDSWLTDLPGDMKPVKVKPGANPPRPAPGRDHLMIFENGRPAFYETDRYVALAFKLNDIGLLSRVGKAISRKTYGIFHPLYVTLSPSWQVFNLPRDIRRTHKNLPIIKAYEAGQKAPTFREVLGAYLEASGPAWRRARRDYDPTIQAMMENKALDVPFASFDWTDDTLAYDRLLGRYGLTSSKKARTKLGSYLASVAAGVERVGVWTETLPKVATWNMVQRRGLTPKTAAHVVRNYVGTPNYKRKGLATELTNGLFMYSNVVLRGIAADAHVATNPKSAGGYWMRSLMLDFMPKMVMRGAAAGMFGAAVKSLFDLIPDYDLANYVVVPLGAYQNDQGEMKAVYVRLPHDDSNRMLAVAMWLLSRGEPRDAVAGAIGQLPFASGWAPPVDMGTKWVAFLTGNNPYDTFRRREIVSRDAWNAGGWYAWQEMVRWNLDQFGIGSVVVDGLAGVIKGAGEAVGVETEGVTGLFVPPGEESIPRWYERVIGGVPGLERIVRISDRGLSERQWDDVQLEDAERARFRLSLPNAARQLVRERYRLNRLGRERLTGPQKYRRQVVNDFYRRSYLPLTREIQAAEEAGDSTRANAIRERLRRDARRVQDSFRTRDEGTGDDD